MFISTRGEPRFHNFIVARVRQGPFVLRITTDEVSSITDAGCLQHGLDTVGSLPDIADKASGRRLDAGAGAVNCSLLEATPRQSTL